MTNFEYFKDDILKMCTDNENLLDDILKMCTNNENLLAVRNDIPVFCRDITCIDCDLFRKSGRCDTNVIQWLCSEHRVD